MPKDRPDAVVCGSGYRAAIAASFLQREGYPEVANVVGGMSAWKAAGLPMAGGSPARFARSDTGETPMKEFLFVVGFLVVWVVLNRWVLPRLGVPT